MAKALPVAEATEDDFARFYGGMGLNAQWAGRVMRRGKLVAAFGGAIETQDGVWLAFLDVPAHLRTPSLYRHARMFLAEVKASGAQVIRASVDDGIPRALDFMQRLGFMPTDETIDGRAVYEWRN